MTALGPWGAAFVVAVVAGALRRRLLRARRPAPARPSPAATRRPATRRAKRSIEQAWPDAIELVLEPLPGQAHLPLSKAIEEQLERLGLTEAGARPLRYNKENLLNPHFIAYGKVE